MKDLIRKEIIQVRLKEELEACKIPFIEIAAKVGINPALISQYRTGKKLPSLITLAKICEVIGADCNYILGITN